nr:hypothetical protein [Tanacetum cinerariifolium]
VPTPPSSSIAQPSSPPQQQQPSQPTTISMDLLNSLLETCTVLTRRVENLEQDKIAQALEILKLKKRIRKLEKKKKLKASGLQRLKKDDVEEPAELQEVIEVVTTAATTTIIVVAPITAATIIVVPTAARRRKKDDVIEQVKEKGKQDNVYQALQRKLQIEAQARKNMMVYLKNMVGFKMDYFKGMSYDDIHPIFEKYFNSNVAFLEKSKEQLEEEESKALKRQSESLEEKAAKKQKLDKEVEELKKHLQIEPNDDNDVYTEATPLALKVPVVDYEIYTENNKPYYKIIRADGSHQLFLSFQSLLKNFDREDLEMLCSSLEESKRRSWFSKSQKLDIVRVLWSAYHNIYNYIDDLAGREKISIDKAAIARRIQTRVEFGYILNKDQAALELMLLKTSKIYSKGLRLLVKDLLPLIQIDAAG